MATILVADDHPVNRQFLAKLLGYYGHVIVEAADGREALDLVRSVQPALIITDITMPRLDGVGFVKELRADKATARIPVIFYTASYQVPMAQAMARDLDIAHILHMPTRPEEILQTVSSLLGTPVPTAPRESALLEIENARLAALTELGLDLTRERDPRRLLNKFCRALLHVVRTDNAGVLICDDRGRPVRHLQLPQPERAADAASLGRELLARLRSASSKRLVRPDVEPALLALGEPVAALLIAAIPLPENARQKAWLYAVNKVEADEFSAEDERLAVTLAAQMAVGYDNARLHEEASIRAAELEEEVVQRRRQQEALREGAQLAALTADISLALTRADNLREVISLCAEAVVRNLDAAFARVWTVSADHQTLELQASAGLYTHLDGPHSRVPIGKFKIGLIAQERKPHLTNDVANDPRISDQEWARREGMVAFAGYPLLVDSRLVGVMALFARQPLSEAAFNALGTLANHVAVGIERKRSEESLRRTQERLKQVIESSPAVLYDLFVEAGQARPAWISSNVRRMIGYEREEAMQSEWWRNITHPDERENLRHEFDKLLTSGHNVVEHRVRHKDGSYRWIRDEQIFRSTGQDFGEIVGSWSDVTERRILEEQFQQAQKMEAVGRLAGGVAHDFNNLLTIINGYCEVIRARLRSGDPLQEFVDQIERAGERAAGLTRQLLAFSRKQVLVPTTVHLNDLLEEMGKMLGRLIGEDIELTVVPGAKLGTITADPGQIEQVIMNIVVNARDAMPQGGKLTIETKNVQLDDAYVHTHAGVRAGRYVLLAISDTGSGMDAATKARIFEPFFSTKGERGTGLGLATVYGIVRQSGGSIEVHSELDVGTTFTVYLPRDVETAVTELSEPGLRPTVRGTETILVAEDDDGVRGLTRTVLQQFGYKILEARNGGEALMICERHPELIHLLLTDVVMPNMSGSQLAERLRRLRPDLKVLYVSGYTDDAIVRHGVSEGVPFLQKPFSPDALGRKVREVLAAR